MNVFTQNNRYYNLPKYLLFLLKHSVYMKMMNQPTLLITYPRQINKPNKEDDNNSVGNDVITDMHVDFLD
jgi:hypothetical protein